jgi:predicted permease
MAWLNIVITRLRGLFRREAVLEDIEEEIRLHVEMQTQTNIERGMRAEEARRAALRTFGNLGHIREVGYQIRGGGLMDTLWQDIRYGARMLAKDRGFTFVAVLTLALGIGANTAIFSLVNGILLRPLPYREPDRLVRLIQASPNLGLATWGVSHADFAEYQEQNRSFETIALFTSSAVNLTGDGEPERLPMTMATADFFEVFGVHPVIGRGFREGEDAAGKNGVCVISYGLWQRRFGGDPTIIGKSLTLNNRPMEVVGVMPPEFKFPRLEIDVWIPLALDRMRTAPYFFQVVGRLKPGLQVAQAQQDTTDVLQDYGRRHPNLSEAVGLDEGNGPRTIVTPLKEVLVGKSEKPLLVLFGAVALVLLIACANVANLLLARATSRTREIAVRVTIGASPSRVARQLLTESVLLSSAGGFVGTGLAWAGVRMLGKLPIKGIVRIEEVNLSGTVLAFTGGLAVLTGLVFGLMPALRAWGMGLAAGIREGARGSAESRRINSTLVAAQFALSLILLIGTGLLLRSFQRLESVNPGFNPEQTLTMAATLPPRGKYDKPEQALQFYRNAAGRLGKAPGIRAAGFATSLPFASDGNADGIIIEGHEPPGGNVTQAEQAILQNVTPGLFQALGIPLLRGRDFQETDGPDSMMVAIIDEPLARHYWPDGDAIGRRIETTGDRQWMTVVGIVGGVNSQTLAEEKAPHLYLPMGQWTTPNAFLVVRTEGSPSAAFPTLRHEMKELEPDLPIYQVRSMSEIVGRTLSTQRLTNLLLTSFAISALLLAAVGIYGTMSIYVGGRTKEFGIRLALGARPSALLTSVLQRGLALTGSGVVFGLAGALALTRTIKSLLFDVSATDPFIFAGVSVVLVIVALAACYVPARRSAGVDPLLALRYE